jgi:hypothetical protein
LQEWYLLLELFSCFIPLAFNAQGSVSNTTNAQVSEQEEENNNKAIIVASTGAIFDSGIIGPGQASKRNYNKCRYRKIRLLLHSTPIYERATDDRGVM